MRHVYVHVPFCRRRCTYCDFSIAVRPTVPADEFVEAIVREMGESGPADQAGPGPIETLYLGGGTPSLLPPGDLTRLIDHFRERWHLAADVEITIEANPDDVTASSAEAWVGAGVNRVSIGVQSTHPTVLEWMHRTHTPDDGPAAVETVRRAGIARVSADVIFGLPDALPGDPLDTCHRVVDAGAGHVSAYGLTVEPATPLAKREARGTVTRPEPERYAEQFLALHDWLTGQGFEHYEVSNYSRPEEASRHNRCYWSGEPYRGLGPSAHSHAGRERWWNVAPWAEYLRRVRAGHTPVEGRERLNREQERLERMYLGLRQASGLATEELAGLNPAALGEARTRGWLRDTGTGIGCTPEGWLRLDELIVGLTTLP